MKERGLWCLSTTSPDLFKSLTKTLVPLRRGEASLAAWRLLYFTRCCSFMFLSLSSTREKFGALGTRVEGNTGTLVFSFLPMRSSLGEKPLCRGVVR